MELKTFWEKWKDIPGYEGYYQANALGDIRSVDRCVNHNYGGVALRKSRVLKLNTYGRYKMVCLQREGIEKMTTVHSLIAKTFLPIPDFDKPQVNHKNGDKYDNRVENLEWCTCSENTRHAIRTGLRRPNQYSELIVN